MDTMFVPLLLLAAAGVLGWLSVGDRTSSAALTIVEIEGRVGVPLWVLFGLAGLVLLAFRLSHTRRAAAVHPARPLTRDVARPLGNATPPPSSDWLQALRVQAKRVTDDAMGRVRFDEAPGIPLSLVLTSVTPEQARRRIAAFAAWLATIPTPPGARVRCVSSPDIEGPLHAVFRGELVRHFPGDAFTTMARTDGADVLFLHPDPRWDTR
jgi:hypothetical protein